jgi:L-cystine transport system permease protein
MSFDFSAMGTALEAALKYTPITLLLAVEALAAGILFGTLIALTRVYNIRILDRVSQVFVVTVKGIPLILILLVINIVFSQGFDSLAGLLHLGVRSKDVDPIFLAFAGLTIFSSATVSEIVRGSLLSVDKGQYEASYAAGMTKVQTLRRIVLPQAVTVATPMLCNTFIGLLKGSSLVFILSITDLYNAAQITATANYCFLEATVAAAIVYWTICALIERLSVILERTLSAHLAKTS